MWTPLRNFGPRTLAFRSAVWRVTYKWFLYWESWVERCYTKSSDIYRDKFMHYNLFLWHKRNFTVRKGSMRTEAFISCSFIYHKQSRRLSSGKLLSPSEKKNGKEVLPWLATAKHLSLQASRRANINRITKQEAPFIVRSLQSCL